MKKAVWPLQVTSHQLRQQKEVEKQAAAEEAKRRELAAKREVEKALKPIAASLVLFHIFSTCLSELASILGAVHCMSRASCRLMQCLRTRVGTWLGSDSACRVTALRESKGSPFHFILGAAHCLRMRTENVYRCVCRWLKRTMGSLWRGKTLTGRRQASTRAGWKLRLPHSLSGTARLRTGILRSTCLAFLYWLSHVVPAWAVRRKDYGQAVSTLILPVQRLKPAGHFLALNGSQSERVHSAHIEPGIACTCMMGADSLLHVCRRAKAAYAAWSEQWIADMKLEKPGLRQQQYKDLCWKAWQRSPDNPLNQVKTPA